MGPGLGMLFLAYTTLRIYVASCPDVVQSVQLRDSTRDMADQLMPRVKGTPALRGIRRALETTIVVVGPKTLVIGDPDLTKWS